MRFAFVKGHGSGNDFPVIDGRALDLSDGEWTIVARALADRRGPVGGDGILVLNQSEHHFSFGFRMWNPDGSEAETCLNGLRLVARMGFAALGVERATVHLKTSTAEVAHDAEIAPGVYTVRETAGPATLGAVEQRIDALPGDYAFTSIAIPNPHLIAFVAAIDDVDLIRIGNICEAAPDWLPNRANVSFVETRGADAIFVRTFERGVGLTASCGSAMAASAFAAALTGRSEFARDITIFNKGGLVRARAESDGMVTLSGNATFEWEGEIDVDPATGIAGNLTVTRHYNDEIAAWARAVEGAAAP